MIATGLMTVSFQNLGIWIPIERDRGVLKRYRGTPMPKWVYFAGKVLMILGIAIAETVVLLLMSVLFFGLELPSTAARWLAFGWVSLLGITACTLLGIAISSLARTSRSGSAVVTPIALILQFTSGVFLVFTSLPGWMQSVSAIFPLKWMCQACATSSCRTRSPRRSRPGRGSWAGSRWCWACGAWPGWRCA